MSKEKTPEINPIIARNLAVWDIQTLINSLVVNRKDGSILLKVPGGEFEMGDGEDDNCPKHVVHVNSFYMGVYCVTNRQYKQFVDETGHRAPDKSDYSGHTPIWKGKSYPAEYADHPVVCVSWE